MPRSIAALLMESERQKEVARRAAIELVTAKPPPPRVTKQNWIDWNRYGWFVCPGKWQRGCSDPDCVIGARCRRMAALGLAGDGSPLSRRDRPSCAAQTRKGAPCLGSSGTRKTTLPAARWARHRPYDRRGQGAHCGSAAQTLGQVARYVVGPARSPESKLKCPSVPVPRA
jgi:hypothetical protein